MHSSDHRVHRATGGPAPLRWLAAGGLAGALLTLGFGPTGPTGASGATATGDTSAWTVYHGDPAGSGVAPPVTAVTTSRAAWMSPTLDGQLYGEPLVDSGDVFVATENDTVYALSGSTGAVVWSTHLASPVPATSLPCGDITPTVGITGTPVIDQVRHEIFVVADELVHGSPAHQLVGLNTANGAIELDQNVDPPGAAPAALLQRTGLTLDAGQVVFAMGGNYGDCASYRGRVGSVTETGGSPTFFTVDAASGDSQGAIWMGGAAPAVDASGNIWVAVGNGSVYSGSQPYDDSDSALELSSSLQLEQYFAPSSWPANNANDLDMSMAPTLLADGQVLLAGKSRIAYLLNGTHLGGIGGQEATLAAACDQDIAGGSAVLGTTVFLPCPSGPVAVAVTASPPALRVQWSASVGGGPPIVAAGLVWTIGQDGTLYGLDPSTGAVRQQAAIGPVANHFPTPSVGDGLLLAPAEDHVVAFAATGSGTSTTAGPTTTTTARPHGHAATATVPGRAHSDPGLFFGIVGGLLVVLIAVAWLLHRRRRRRIFH